MQTIESPTRARDPSRRPGTTLWLVANQIVGRTLTYPIAFGKVSLVELGAVEIGDDHWYSLRRSLNIAM